MTKYEACSCARKCPEAFLIFHTLVYDFFLRTLHCTRIMVKFATLCGKKIVDKCVER